MDNYRESVLMALIVVVLVSVPAASQNVEISGEDEGVINSMFSDYFEADFKSGKEVLVLEDSDAKLRINETFKKDVRMLQTPTGYFKIVKTNNSIEKVINTPYGKFKFGVNQSGDYNHFKGSDKQKAEELRSDLEDLMSEKESEISEKRDIVVERILPDIKVTVEEETKIEHFNLTNNGDNEVDLTGWTVITEGSGTDWYNLTGNIDSGETVTFYSGTKDTVFSDNQIEVDTTIYSNSNGDGEVRVYNHVNKLVDSVGDY